tara:strand:- start:216 stop:491 length:276 start_codon:yes stop_codon:yes gene_type:complete
MTGKGDRNRTTDRVSYENNWDTVFGKGDRPRVIEERVPQTNESLSQHGNDGWDDEIAKRMREWAIMMDFLRTLKYEDYPVQAAEDLYNSFK